MAIRCIASENVEHANRELVEREVLDCCTRKVLLVDFASRSKADSLKKTGMSMLVPAEAGSLLYLTQKQRCEVGRHMWTWAWSSQRVSVRMRARNARRLRRRPESGNPARTRHPTFPSVGARRSMMVRQSFRGWYRSLSTSWEPSSPQARGQHLNLARLMSYV